MDKVNYLIIGGGIAGTTAAEVIRQNDKSASIAIVSDEPYRLYSRIMLSKPNFFLEKIPFEQIWLKTEEWYEDNNVSFLAGRSAVGLDPVKKEILLDDGAKIQYDKLLLSLGGCVRTWSEKDVKGGGKKGIFYLRTLDQAKAVVAAVKTAKRGISIGSGFISFEMCDMMKLAGLDVTLVMREPHYWDPLLDEKTGRMIESALEKGGVKILRQAEVAEVLGGDKVEGVILKSGEKLDCEMIMVGIGLICPFAWVQAAGVKVNRGVLADEYLQTNIPDIFAAGDSTEFHDLILGENIQLGNWVNAQMQGRVAAMNMLGKKQPFKLVSFYTTQGFGINIAFVGDVRVLPGREVIERGSPEINAFSRLIVADKKIIGATMFNRTQEMPYISKLIEKNWSVAGFEGKLADPKFDLKTLI